MDFIKNEDMPTNPDEKKEEGMEGNETTEGGDMGEDAGAPAEEAEQN